MSEVGKPESYQHSFAEPVKGVDCLANWADHMFGLDRYVMLWAAPMQSPYLGP